MRAATAPEDSESTQHLISLPFSDGAWGQRVIDIARSPPYAHYMLGPAESENAVFTAMALDLSRRQQRSHINDTLDIYHHAITRTREHGTSPHFAVLGEQSTSALTRAIGETDDGATATATQLFEQTKTARPHDQALLALPTAAHVYNDAVCGDR